MLEESAERRLGKTTVEPSSLKPTSYSEGEMKEFDAIVQEITTDVSMETVGSVSVSFSIGPSKGIHLKTIIISVEFRLQQSGVK